MMNIIETIQLDAKHRLAIVPDDSPEDPREWQEGVSVHQVNLNHRYRAPDSGTNSHEYALDALIENAEDLEAALTKHFARAGIPFQLVEHNADRDWVGTFIWYWEPAALAAEKALAPDYTGIEYLDGCVSQYKAWAANEVYGVIFQKLVTWRREDGETGLFDGGPTREEWEEVEAIWGNYLTDDYTALAVAKDYWPHLMEEVRA